MLTRKYTLSPSVLLIWQYEFRPKGCSMEYSTKRVILYSTTKFTWYKHTDAQQQILSNKCLYRAKFLFIEKTSEQQHQNYRLLHFLRKVPHNTVTTTDHLPSWRSYLAWSIHPGSNEVRHANSCRIKHHAVSTTHKTAPLCNYYTLLSFSTKFSSHMTLED